MNLSRDNYLIAKGLWHLAVESRKKTDEYVDALERLLQVEPGSHISDSVYCDGDPLEEALKREDITVNRI